VSALGQVQKKLPSHTRIGFAARNATLNFEKSCSVLRRCPPYLSSEVWAAPGFVDTLFGAMMLNEVRYGTTKFLSRVQV
jgi:hypothetical protein